MERHLGILIAVVLVIAPSITLASEHELTAKVSTGKKIKNITVDTVVDYIIHKYSTEDSVLSFEGYQHLLESLDLGMVDNDHSEKAHLKVPDHGDHSDYGDHNDLDEHGDHTDHDHTHHGDHTGHDHTDHGDQSDHDDHTDHDHTDNGDHGDHGDLNDHDEHGDHDDDSDLTRSKRSLDKALGQSDQRDFRNTCLRPKEILQLMRFTDHALTKQQFIELCPLLIVQLDGHACSHLHGHHHADPHGHEEGKTNVNSKRVIIGCLLGVLKLLMTEGTHATTLINVPSKPYQPMDN